MINNLLAENNADGIAFYELDLGALPSNSFKQKIDRPRIRRASTHLAVAINLENGKIPEISTNGSLANNLLSDRPCPGHCVWITRRRIVRTRNRPTVDGVVLNRLPATETDPPYYTAWDPNNE